jgi:hypothetical protein
MSVMLLDRLSRAAKILNVPRSILLRRNFRRAGLLPQSAPNGFTASIYEYNSCFCTDFCVLPKARGRIVGFQSLSGENPGTAKKVQK